MSPNVPDLSKLAAMAVPLDKKPPQMNPGVPAHKVQVTGGNMPMPGQGDEAPIVVMPIHNPGGLFTFWMPAENALEFGKAIVQTATDLLR